MSDEHAAGRRPPGEGLGDDSKSEPAPDPFYASPPTGARLRWSITWHVVAPLALAALFIASGMAQGHTLGVVIGLVVLAVFTPLQWIRLRPIIRELRSRRQGNVPAAPGSSWIPKGNAALWYVGTLTTVVAGGTLLASSWASRTGQMAATPPSPWAYSASSPAASASGCLRRC